jgi:C4-dicarboxylate-specific signal transduction histidine kinase
LTGLIVLLCLLQAALAAALVLAWRRGHRVEESLAESEERVALATLPRNLGLWRWNPRTHEFWATEQFREILQVPTGVPLDRFSVLMGIHPDDRAHFADVLLNPGNGEIIGTDFRVLRSGGELRWVVGKARATRDAPGHVIRVTGVVVDVTDRKRAALESRHCHLQLAHLTRVAVVGQLSGALAHELTQPLTAILSNAQAAQRVLSSNHVDLGEVREILADIVKDDKRAGEVIRWVRGLLKREQFPMQTLDVPQLVREALMVTHSDLVVRGVEVTCDFAKDLPAVRGDRAQIQQVLLNLILNAAEALTKNQPHDRRIDIRVMPAQDGVQVSIEDWGAGIPPDRLERVFEAFYTTRRDGLGLGLAICRSIVAAHGGKLWATSDGKRGSALHFTLPQYRKPNPSSKPLC